MSIWLRLRLVWSWIDIYRPTRLDGQYALMAFTVYVSVVFVTGVVLFLLPDGPSAAGHSSLSSAGESPTRAQLTLLAFLLFAAAWEELFIRNGIQKALYAVVDPRLAIVLTSGFFAALHIPSFTDGWSLSVGVLLSLAVVFVGSCCIGWAYWKSKNIVVAMAVHADMNSLGWLSAVF